ncbi:ethylbenzene dehydrogenase-related protein [Changchengzhania lutea]|uniref:ethylbenzene dehydrogenase-related protein n=1 Tax=Changchengzhania lutea TaxID=2049305 RepID=UPI00115CAF12|nr:ethylbenzene dehydrogenase-related protein [Changchengzhania lutea]
MKTPKLVSALFIMAIFFAGCTHDDYVPITGPDDGGIGESPDELLVKKFSTAPTFDGDIDDVWSEARPLINKATVTPAGDREITLNSSSGGDLSLEPTDLMDPYTGESYSYSLRGGHDGQYLYLLFEWEDDTDSQDRESWFFNPITSKWQQENKYANHKNDKFYEDKFGFMFPIGNPAGFNEGTCTVTCHSGLADPQPGEKVTRHYMKNEGELADFWHWKRDRHALAEACDDGFVQWEDDFGKASANGRKNDEGISPYANNQTFEDAVTGMKGPKYVIPNRENYYWIAQSEIDGGTAKAVTAIALDGTITHEGGTIDPNGDPAYSQGFGNKRIPSIIINPAGQGNDGRSEVQVKAIHTGSGWQLEIRRLLYTGDPTDAEFKIGETIPFGLAIFNNAAIGHGQTNFLSMKIEN